MRTALARRHLAAACIIAAACGGDDDDGMTNPPPPAPVASVSVSGPSGQWVPGDQVQLVATVRDASGAELTDRVVTWSSSSDAIASIDGNGLVTAVSAGVATMTATSEEQAGTLTFTVLEGGRLGPAGGTLTAFGGAVRLDVPAGALAEPVSITVARATSLPRDPSGLPGSGYTLGPSGTSLGGAAALALRYEPTQGPSGVPETDLRVHQLGGGDPQVMPGQVDAAAHIATGEVTELGTFVVRRAAATTPCTAPEFRQFDFWVGEWRIEVAGLPSGAPQPPSDITLEPGGCAVFENFANGAGLSLNVYNPADGNWHQTFIFSTGQRQILIGGLEGSEMVLTGPAPGPPGSFDRWTWTPLSDGRVRQLQEVSNDGGQTVTPGFDGTYVPR
jgi:hypothetical protein